MRRLAAILILLFAACGEDEAESPPPEVELDTTLSPQRAQIRDGDGRIREVAVVLTETGPFDLIVGEMLYRALDRSTAEAFATNWGGRVLESIEVPQDETLYVVSVDPSLGDPSEIGTLLKAADEDATGRVLVSSEAGLGTLAVHAAAAADGEPATFDFLLETTASFFDEDIQESPKMDGDPSYSSNPFEWYYIRADDPEWSLGYKIGGAWQALEAMDRLGNKVKVGVIDGGFVDNPDFDALTLTTRSLLSSGAFWNQPDTKGGWHGSYTTAVLAGSHDNDYGVAGVGSPVIDEAVLIQYTFTGKDVYKALAQATVAGARIVNMSFVGSIGAPYGRFSREYHRFTKAYRDSGVLLIGSAGNDGYHVDREKCIRVLGKKVRCWEATFYYPCEAQSVECIGGTDWNSYKEHASSNYGSESVDLWAPYAMYVPGDPTSNLGDESVRRGTGTSYSAPFVAGAAALVWAADPSLSANGVADILRETAIESPYDRVRRIVQPLAAVKRALGVDNVPPLVTIKTPPDGSEAGRGLGFILEAEVLDVEDRESCCGVEWLSDIDGSFAAGARTTASLGLGTHTITARAVDSAGAETRSAPIRVRIVNAAPRAEIRQPNAARVHYVGLEVAFEGHGWDPDLIPVDQYEWDVRRVGGGVMPVQRSGRTWSYAFDQTGRYDVSLTVRDADGGTRTVARALDIQPLPANGPPVISILSPLDGQQFFEFDTVDLRADVRNPGATDPGDLRNVTFEWTIDGDVVGATKNVSGVRLRDHVIGNPGSLTPAQVGLRATNQQGTRSQTVDVAVQFQPH